MRGAQVVLKSCSSSGTENVTAPLFQGSARRGPSFVQDEGSPQGGVVQVDPGLTLLAFNAWNRNVKNRFQVLLSTATCACLCHCIKVVLGEEQVDKDR